MLLLAALPRRLPAYDPNASSENAAASSSRVTLVSSAQKEPAKAKSYVCGWDGCDKAYSKPAKLKEHQLAHTGERPHACTQCSATYRRANHLTAHIRTHLPQDQKSFICSHDGCGKKFWTTQHLNRHERSHELELEYECSQCDAAFAKHHQLRSHVAAVHCTPGTKPFRCLHGQCDWSFETSQKLRQHERVHDETRYMCSHSTHGIDMPTFRTWTDLRNHVKSDHPPVCPYPECKGRTFAKNRNLRDHLQVHVEQGDELEAMPMADRVEASDSDEYSAASRKRKRSASVGGMDSPKRLRRTSSDLSKIWLCEIDDCDKRFKSKRALSVHHSTAHLGLRPFACPIATCGATYGHKHLLQRHIAAKHSQQVSEGEPNQPPADEEHPTSQWAILTGTSHLTPAMLAKRPLQCPCDLVASEGTASDSATGVAPVKTRCRHRFARLYDLQRHMRKGHQLDLDEREIRFMLRNSDAGRQPVPSA